MLELLKEQVNSIMQPDAIPSKLYGLNKVELTVGQVAAASDPKICVAMNVGNPDHYVLTLTKSEGDCEKFDPNNVVAIRKSPHRMA